jgi:hypothetical protein
MCYSLANEPPTGASLDFTRNDLNTVQERTLFMPKTIQKLPTDKRFNK